MVWSWDGDTQVVIYNLVSKCISVFGSDYSGQIAIGIRLKPRDNLQKLLSS